MRHLIQLLGVGVILLSTGAATADLGDQLFKLLADDGAANDHFGRSVAISGPTAIVGADADTDNGTNSGSAFLFDTSTGQQIRKLLPNDGAFQDIFGISVAISGAIAIVGAPGDDDNGTDSGSAYLFDASTGVQIVKLFASDGGPQDWFGLSVAISGNTAVVGALFDDVTGENSGSAYLFDISDPNNPAQIAKLVPGDGATFDNFGFSVGIGGPPGKEFAIVAAVGDDDNGTDSGSAYLFDITTGQQRFKLLPNDGTDLDNFGISVGISGNTAIIGARWDDDNGSASGSAYLFDATTGQQIAKLLPGDGAAGDHFGISVAISGPPGMEVAIVGTFQDDDNGSNSGSAYLFDATTHEQIAKLLPNDGAAGDRFGRSVAISGLPGQEVAIGGADLDNDNGGDSGSAYLFDAGTAADAALTGLAIETGVLLGGDLTDLESSNDSYVHTRSGFGSTLIDLHHMDMRINAQTTVKVPATLDLTIESHISEPVGTARIRLFNFTTGRFDFVGQHAVLPTDTINTIPDIDATNYVNAQGDIQLSIKHIVFVPFLAFTFESWIDLVEIVVQ